VRAKAQVTDMGPQCGRQGVERDDQGGGECVSGKNDTVQPVPEGHWYSAGEGLLGPQLRRQLGLLSNRIGANFTKFDLLFSNRTYIKVRFAAN